MSKQQNRGELLDSPPGLRGAQRALHFLAEEPKGI
jgi:hypothetical protein